MFWNPSSSGRLGFSAYFFHIFKIIKLYGKGKTKKGEGNEARSESEAQLFS